MRMKRTAATIALGAALSLTGATAASADHTQARAAGLIAAAVAASDTVDIDTIRILTNEGVINIPVDVDVQNNRILTGIIVQALNNIDVNVTDVNGVVIDGSTVIVDVL